MRKRQDYSKRAENGITWAQQESRNSLIVVMSIVRFCPSTLTVMCVLKGGGGAYYSLRGATGSWPKRASNFGFPGRGQVWNHTHAHVIDGKHSNDSEGENITAVEIDVEN